MLFLQGTSSNRSAIGAKIQLTFKENAVVRNVFRDLNSGGSFGSSPLRREIGIGKATIIDELKILWPSGKIQIFKNLKPNQFLKVVEGGATIENIPLQQLNYSGKTKYIIECLPVQQKAAPQ